MGNPVSQSALYQIYYMMTFCVSIFLFLIYICLNIMVQDKI